MSRRIAIPRPSDFGTVGGWYPPGDRTATLISGKYSVSPDRSGNGWDLLQGTAGQRPSKVTSGGRPARRYVAANSTYMATASFGAIAHPIVYWIVLKLTTQTGVSPPTPFYTYVGGGVGDALYAPDGTHVNLYGDTLTIGAAFDMTAGFASYVGICNGVSSSLRINGTQVASGTLAGSSFTAFTEGSIAPVGGGQEIDGDVLDSGFFLGLPPSIPDFEKYYLRREFQTW